MEWKVIKSLNEMYEVSNTGEIRNSKTKRIMKQQVNTHGYHTLTVRPKPNKQINVRVHRLVAETFLGECSKGYVVNHIDGNKQNNSVENLQYITPSQNNKHALDNGLRKPANMKLYAPKGEQHYNVKLTEKDVRYILQLRNEYGYGERKLSKITCFSRGTIGNILSNRSWKHIERSFNYECKCRVNV